MKTLTPKQRAKIYRNIAEATFKKQKCGLLPIFQVPELMLFANHGYADDFMFTSEGIMIRALVYLLAEQIALNPIYKNEPPTNN